jgi:hypothetical protein
MKKALEERAFGGRKVGSIEPFERRYRESNSS